MKQDRKLPFIIIITLIAAVVFISLLIAVITIDSPSSSMAKLTDIYPVSEDGAPIFVNGNLTEVRAVMRGKHAYLPLGRVRDEINDCFYYDETEKVLLCTSALEVIRADESSVEDDCPVFYDSAEDSEEELSADERIYVLLDYVAAHTNISIETYAEPSRVFIRSKYGEVTYGYAAEDGVALRVEPGKKSDMVTELTAGTKLWIIESSDGWCRAYAGGNYGHVGYISADDLSEVSTVNDPGEYNAPEYTRLTISGNIRLVWHQVLHDSGVDALPSLLKTAGSANVICPTWFSVVSSDGSIESRANDEYVSIAKSNGLHVWALVENFNTENDLDYEQLLGTSYARANMIDRLIYEAREHGIEGINVDFEGLPSDSGEDYIQFLRELSVACRKAQLILSVDNYVPSAWTEFYNRKAQSEFVDYFIIMAYDEHYYGSDAGSTASLSFVKAGIEDTIAEGVDPSKILVGIPFFSRMWSGEGAKLTSETINMADMTSFRNNHGDSTSWDSELGQYYTECTVDGTLKRLWSENSESLSEKLKLIKSYNVAGIAGWKLGMETSEAWTAINNYFY